MQAHDVKDASGITMRNKYATHVDFTFLADTVGKMFPSNIDMVLERNGHFLVGEWKREQEKISQGQMILLRRLASLKQFKVLVITGHSDNKHTEVYAISKLEYNGNLVELGKSIEDLKVLISKWLRYAERQRHGN